MLIDKESPSPFLHASNTKGNHNQWISLLILWHGIWINPYTCFLSNHYICSFLQGIFLKKALKNNHHIYSTTCHPPIQKRKNKNLWHLYTMSHHICYKKNYIYQSINNNNNNKNKRNISITNYINNSWIKKNNHQVGGGKNPHILFLIFLT